jgi:hypothetical protein
MPHSNSSVCVLAASLILVGRAVPASAAQNLYCVTPRATITKGALHRTWINVYTKPSRKAPIVSYTIASPLGLWVIAESNGFLHVTTGDSMADWPFKPHADLGWVRADDVQGQAIRNCT